MIYLGGELHDSQCHAFEFSTTPHLPAFRRRRLAADARHPPRTAGRRRPRSARAEAIPFPGPGAARDLSVHERRRLARRFVRSQAEADRRPWPDRHAQPPRNAQPARLRTAVPEAAAMDVSTSAASAASRSATCSRTSRECADDLCVIRSMHTDHSNHYNATLGMHTGSFTFARPSIGSWVSYGLGTPNQNLPSFVAIAPQLPTPAARCGRPTSCPAATRARSWCRDRSRCATSGRASRRPCSGANSMPLARAQPPARGAARRATRHWTRASAPSRPPSACRSAAPEAFDLSARDRRDARRSTACRAADEGFAWQCLVARRLAERGVRFIELIDSGSSTTGTRTAT